MTICVGFEIGTAAILCTDSQEVVSDYSKTTTQKIQTTDYFGNWRMGIAGAGDAAYLDSFQQGLQAVLGIVKEYDYQKIVKLIDESLNRFYKNKIWSIPADTRPSSCLLLASLHHLDTPAYTAPVDENSTSGRSQQPQ